MAAVRRLSARLDRLPLFHRLLILAIATGVIYAWQLSSAPVHLHYDEVLFGEQARSIAAHGRDINNRWLPVYFQMDSTTWFHPLGVYLPAITFLFAPISVAALRLSTVLVGVLDVMLITLLALRILKQPGTALLAGALLAVTPAHFIHSRMAVDYLFPTPFVLGWSLLLLRFIETRKRRDAFVAGSVLGLGAYSYIAAVALMPLLLLLTILLLWVERVPFPAHATVVAGFLWPLIPAAIFVSTHPEMAGSTMGRYGVQVGQLDVLQELQHIFSPWFIVDRAKVYLSFFAPGYLFISGGASPVMSTRFAGVFLLGLAPLMLLGLRSALVRYSPATAVVLAGLLLPPLAASVVAEQFSIGRATAMVPFGILLAVLGVADLRKPIAAVLLVACALQFALFTRDYFGDYRSRSAFWFNGNLRDAVHKIVERTDARTGERPRVLLDAGIQRVEWYWRFYLAEMGRSDLEGRAQSMGLAGIEQTPHQPGTLILIPWQDPEARRRFDAIATTVAEIQSDPPYFILETR